MKRIYFLVVALMLLPLGGRAELHWTSAPPSVREGEAYTVSVTADGAFYADLYLYKNGALVGAASDGEPSLSIDSADSQTANYYAEAYLYLYWGGEDYRCLWHDVQITYPLPMGAFETVSINPIPRGQSVTASGWAVAYAMGAPVAQVNFYVDGVLAGQATRGGYRPDVQDANLNYGFWSPYDVTYSGWSISYNTSGLTIGDHTLRIVAYDHRAKTADLGTKTFSVALVAQSITFINPGMQVNGVSFTLDATASSGLPVSFAVASGPATVSGNTVIITGVGVVTITASQPGSANFGAAPSVSQSFTVQGAAASSDIPAWMKTLLKVPSGSTPAPDPSGGFKVHKP